MARRPSISGRYLVDAEENIGQSKIARSTQRKSAETYRPRGARIAPPAKMPNCCRPSLAVLRQSAISGRANRSPEVKIGPFAGQKPAFESRFCGAFKPAPGRLETHAKNPIYSIAC